MEKMDDSCYRWLRRTAAKHHWRVASFVDLDDLIQDGYLTYQRVLLKYPELRTRRQIMAMFKRIYHMHLHDLANWRTKRPREVLHSDLAVADADEDNTWDQLLAQFDDELMLIVEAPERVRQALLAVMSEVGQKRMTSEYRVRKDGTRETLNDRLCSMLGYDPGEVDLVKPMRDYLRGGQQDETESLVDKMVDLMSKCSPGKETGGLVYQGGRYCLR